MMDIPWFLWVGTVAAIVALVIFDMKYTGKHPHKIHAREAAFWSIFYIGIALLFAVVILLVGDGQAATEYLTGWLVEKSLSIDNLFVFLIIMQNFRVPESAQSKVLLFGVVGALLLRSVLILIGAAALNLFSFTFVVFGLLLLFTGIQMLRHRNEEPELHDNAVIRLVRRRFFVASDYDGEKLLTQVDNKRAVTPLFIVFVTIATTDLLFALDSIPAIFGITHEAFIVFAANAFALLGLRALFFLLKDIIERFVYLSTGLSIILIFIGLKLVAEWAHDVWPVIPHVTTLQSLAVILAILAATIVASLIASRKDPSLRAKPSTVRKARSEEAAGTSEFGITAQAQAQPEPQLKPQPKPQADPAAEQTPEEDA